jgi:DNA repair ATPase RecN
MSTENRVFSKLFKDKTNLSKKVKLKMLDNLVSAMQRADDKRIEFYNIELDWVNKYLDLQNDFPKLESVSQDYKQSIIELREVMEEFKASASILGLDPREIPQFEDAMLTEGIFNENADSSIEVINAGVNMSNNKL